MRLRLALLTALLLPAAAHAEGMPQLDFGNPLTTSQVVWGAIIFAVLYILLSRSALPGVASVIEERARHIASDLETAQAAKARSDEFYAACATRGDGTLRADAPCAPVGPQVGPAADVSQRSGLRSSG